MSARFEIPRFDRDYSDPAVAAHYARERWERTAHARRTNRREQALLRALLEQAGPLEQVLDVPCGAGRFLGALGEHARSVVGADASLHMVAEAAALGTVPVFGASVEALPFRDGAFDLVCSIRLLHHYARRESRVAVLAELARVSRRFVLVSYYDAATFQAARNRLRGKKLNRFPIRNRAFREEAAAAGLRLAARRFRARRISEQVLALLERGGA